MTTPVVLMYTLDEGNIIPSIGLGTWPLNDEEAERAERTVLSGIELGYRLIDFATN